MSSPKNGLPIAGVLVLAAVAGACSTAPTTSPTQLPSGSPVTSAPTTTATQGAVATPQGSLDRIAGWQADIGAIVPGLERIHPNPFHGTSRTDLEAAASRLAADAPTLTDDQLMVGVAKIAALVSAKGCDAHTGLYVWGTGTSSVPGSTRSRATPSRTSAPGSTRSSRGTTTRPSAC